MTEIIGYIHTAVQNLLPELVTALFASAVWALAKLGNKLASETVHNNTWKVLTILQQVSSDVVSKSQASIAPLIGKAPMATIVGALKNVALSEVNALGEDVLKVAGWTDDDLAAGIVKTLETEIARRFGTGSPAPATVGPPVPTQPAK